MASVKDVDIPLLFVPNGNSPVSSAVGNRSKVLFSVRQSHFKPEGRRLRSHCSHDGISPVIYYTISNEKKRQTTQANTDGSCLGLSWSLAASGIRSVILRISGS